MVQSVRVIRMPITVKLIIAIPMTMSEWNANIINTAKRRANRMRNAMPNMFAVKHFMSKEPAPIMTAADGLSSVCCWGARCV